jgi:hypothetical protein
MNPSSGTEDWVGEYLEWTQPDGWTIGARSSATDDGKTAREMAGDEFVTAYLDWLDLELPMRVATSPYRAADPAGAAGASGRDMAGLDAFRDALLAALRTESDCLRFLRRVLDAGGAPPRMVKFASKALKHAERLLEDERRAWRQLQHYEWPHSRLAWDAAPEGDWPHALEQTAADVRALKGTVVAAQRH